MTNKTIIAHDELNKTGSVQTSPASLFSSRFNTIVSNTEYLNQQSEDLSISEDLDALFENIEKFTEGGQGELKTARDKKLHRYVALKSLKKDFLSNPAIVQNFILEARITAQLDHPSIIPMYGIIRDHDSFIHMAMKLVQGHTLEEIIKDQSIECKRLNKLQLIEFEKQALYTRLTYFIKVCEALAYAHNKLVIHRDLKPENIMVGSFNEVYLMDWGIAKIMSDEARDEENQKTKKSVSGTPGFIAPENILTGRVDFSCDQYALGAILFQLVTLKPHILGEDGKELLEKTLHGQTESIEHAFPHIRIAPELKSIIRKAMAHEPKQRYEDITALSKDITKFLQAEETEALKDNLWRACIRKLYKHKMRSAVSILVLLLIFAGITIASLVQQKQSIQISQQRELTLINFQSSLVQRASQIDSHFLKLSNILERYAEKVLYLLESPANNKRILKFYDYRDFKKLSSTIPGYQESSGYQQKISLKAGNYKLVPNLSPSAVKDQLLALSPIVDDSLNYIASSDEHTTQLSDLELQKHALKQGFPIRWIYTGLPNGLLINYPGMGDIGDDYDVRARFWFKNSQTQNQLFWSSPYLDLFGQGLVVSAIKPLITKQGKFLGASAIDLTFDYALNTIMAASEDSKMGIRRNRYLINQDGKVILSNLKEMSNIAEAERTQSEIQFKPFPYPSILQTILQQQSGQIKIEHQGQTRLIGFSPIPTLNWFYVEELNFDSLINRSEESSHE